MARLLSILRRRLPRRRRRLWRYVSGRRRHVGTVALLSMVVLAFLYWHRTNDERIRREVLAYLTDLTGGRVKIDGARFRLFEGIRIENLSVELPGDEHLMLELEAKEVLLAHRIRSLFLRRRIEPTEIVADRPTVRLAGNLDLEQDAKSRVALAVGRSRIATGIALPTVRIRQGALIYRSRLGSDPGQAANAFQREYADVWITLVPNEKDGSYRLTLNSTIADKPGLRGEIGIDLATGRVHINTLLGDLEDMLALLRQYRKFDNDFDLRGRAKLEPAPAPSGGPAAPGTSTAPAAGDGAGPVAPFMVTLEGASMTLPLEALQSWSGPGAGKADMVPPPGRPRPSTRDGIALTDVKGKLVFRSKGVEIVDLAGRTDLPGNPTLSATGSLDGYGWGSPFCLQLDVRGLQLPLAGRLERAAKAMGDRSAKEQAERLWKEYARIGEKVHFYGTTDVSIDAWRQADGTVGATGVVQFKDGRAQLMGDDRLAIAAPIGVAAPFIPIPMSIPIPLVVVENVAGTVSLTPEAVTLTGLTGTLRLPKAGLDPRQAAGGGPPAAVRAEGRLSGGPAGPQYDVRLVVKDMPFDENVRKILDEEGRRLWRDFSPTGRADVEIHACRPAEKSTKGDPEAGPAESFEAAINFTGGASLLYCRFPYPLGKVTGQVVMRPGSVRIINLRGQNAPAACTINGQVDRGPEGWDVEVTVDVTDIPLDEQLARAIGPRSRAVYLACGISGRADVSKGVIRQVHSGPVTMSLPTTFRDARIVHKEFPYAIEQSTGELTITDDRVDIHRVVGRHGRAKITLDGSAAFLDEGEDVRINAQAIGMPLDEDLRRALPQEARDWWDQLEPVGVANATVTLAITDEPPAAGRTARGAGVPARPAGNEPRGRANPAGKAKPRLDFLVILAPQDARIRYRHFPVALDKLAGRIEVRPNEVLLKGMTATLGEAAVALDGTISGEVGSERARLSVSTGRVVIDKALLAALPPGLVETLGLSPGGTVELDLKGLSLGWAEAATQPAAIRPAAPTAPSDVPIAWSWDGTVSLTEAELDLGFGPKRVTGTVKGRVGSDGPVERMHADLDIDLKDLAMGARSLSKLTAKMAKKADSPVVRIGDLAADAFGGRVAGSAEASLGRDRRYALDLAVERLDLAGFVNAGKTNPKDRFDVKGLLTGSLQMTAEMGKPATRRATGSFSMTQGKLYRLPVMLSWLQVVLLTLPGDAAYDTAEVEYYVKGEKLIFREIHLQGSAGSMIGAGTVDLSGGQLRLTFLTGPPQRLPRLEALGELIEGLASGLATVRVTGTLTKPVTRTAPLREPGRTLRELYAPED